VVVVGQIFPNFPSHFLNFHFTKWRFYLYKICLEYPWGFPFKRDFGLNVNCKNTPRKQKAWPAATLLSGGGRENTAREKICSIITMLSKEKK